MKSRRLLLLIPMLVQAALAGLPLHFEPSESAGYRAVGVGYEIGITARGAELQLGNSRLAMRLDGVRSQARVQGLDEQAARSNYLVGRDETQWRRDVRHYARVRVSEAYPGVDVIYYGQGRQLEYDFVVRPHADATRIGFRLEGAQAVRLDKAELVAQLDGEQMRWHQPVAYQVRDGQRVEVAAHYELAGGHVRFALGDYDHNRELVIDPVLSYSSFMGSRGNEAAISLARDVTGNLYLTGVTTSPTLGVTRGVLQTTYGGETGNKLTGDAFVAKYNSAGVLLYLTFLGGTGDDYATTVVADDAGNAYITGFTNSRNFPVSATAMQKTFGGSGGANPCKVFGDAFVTKLNPTGTQIVYSTYLGGSRDDAGASLVIDADGNAYVSGSTISNDFPTTPGAYQTKLAGVGGQPATQVCAGAPSFYSGDAFVAKIDANGSRLVFSTLIGGSRDDAGTGIGLDPAGNVYLAGSTISSDFPTTAGAYQRTFGGIDDQNLFLYSGDGFVAKFNPTGTAVQYSTYLGGRGDEFITSLRVDGTGSVYVGGSTSSTNFPTTATAIGKVYGGYYFQPFLIEHTFGDGFITRLNPAGSAVVYSTYLVGQNNDFVWNFWVDPAGLIYTVGWTESSNYRVTADAHQKLLAGVGGQADYIIFGDGFLTVIDPSSTTPVYSSFFGGKNDDMIFGVVGDGAGGVWLAGNTLSADFPIVTGAAQSVFGGSFDYKWVKGDAMLMRVSGFSSRAAIAALTNAASNATGAVSPGMIFVGYGSGMGPTTLVGAAIDANGLLANSRSGTRVLFDGVPAPLVYVSSGQVSGIVPYAVANKSSTQVTVEVNGQVSGSLSVPVVAAVPGLFSQNFSGSGPAVVFNEDGSVNSQANPAARGSIIVLFGTGEGQTTPVGVDGQIASTVFPKPALPVSVLVGNVAASEVLYAGAVPGNVAGLLQVNARIAPSTPAGTQSIVLRVGSFSSQPGLTVFVK